MMKHNTQCFDTIVVNVLTPYGKRVDKQMSPNVFHSIVINVSHHNDQSFDINVVQIFTPSY